MLPHRCEEGDLLVFYNRYGHANLILLNLLINIEILGINLILLDIIQCEKHHTYK